ncbi:hypothetical protein MMC13_004318 [Lambiella insularis]|nr:hypothetical protein [Lambiella insularis]
MPSAGFFTTAVQCYLRTRTILLLISLVVSQVRSSAISVPVSTQWIGDDGDWNPVIIRVGHPPQYLNVLADTVSQETWVIGQAGSGNSGYSICSSDRGGLFASNESNSWQSLGGYALGMDAQLFGVGAGYYGLDEIALASNVSVSGQIISVVNDTQYWLGCLGLGSKASNFTNGEQPSFLSSLASHTIPSLSYSYTAGAPYQLKQVPSSLVLGGFDLNRFHNNDITFQLSPDMNPVVSIEQLSVTAAPAAVSNLSALWSGNAQISLFDASDSYLFTIDSSTPFLWLPEAVCAKLEEAFNITYNDEVQLYLLSDTQHQTLKIANLSFTYDVADFSGHRIRSH